MTAPALSIPVKVLRSATAGRRPGDGTFRALADGELFVNTQDRVLCYLSAAGAPLTVPLDPAFFAGLAPLASPALTGTPTAPTAAAGTSTTQLATTAFVAAEASRAQAAEAGKAAKGANADITSLTGLTNPTLFDNCGRLSVTSSTGLTYAPYNGNQLVINGVSYTIPPGGWTYTATGLNANNTYYVYLYISNGTPTLYLNGAGYLFDATGRAVINSSGSPSSAYRLVGMVYTNSAGQLADQTSFRGVASFFNRRSRTCMIQSSNNYNVVSTSPTIITGVGYFLSWADEDTQGGLSGSMLSSSTTTGGYTYLYIDAVGNNLQNAGIVTTAPNTSYTSYMDIGSYGAGTLGEGAHTLAAYGQAMGGSNGIFYNYATARVTTRI